VRRSIDGTKTWDTFLSYSSRDKAIAQTLIQDLHRCKFSVFYDSHDIVGGDRIREKLNEGISNAKSFLILLSRNSLHSR
jgi:hypothetical protein